MIKPTVGRHVDYWPKQNDPIHPKNTDQPHAAIICRVHDDRLVNLTVFDADGYCKGGFTSIPLLQDDDKAPEQGGYATWMDYQKGQAAKTEALESELKKPPGKAKLMPANDKT